jgi:hypothetical protein
LSVRKILEKAMEDALEQGRLARESRKKPQRNRKKPGMAKEDRAPELCEYLRWKIKSTLGSLYQPHAGAKEWGQMRKLRDQQGGPNVRKVIDWITIPENWQKVRRECGLTAGVPTAGILLGFQASIFPMALDEKIEKRSGAVAPRESEGSDPVGFF